MVAYLIGWLGERWRIKQYQSSYEPGSFVLPSMRLLVRVQHKPHCWEYKIPQLCKDAIALNKIVFSLCGPWGIISQDQAFQQCIVCVYVCKGHIVMKIKPDWEFWEIWVCCVKCSRFLVQVHVLLRVSINGLHLACLLVNNTEILKLPFDLKSVSVSVDSHVKLQPYTTAWFHIYDTCTGEFNMYPIR